MCEVELEGEMVVASPDSPDVARCPECGGRVVKRKGQRMDGGVTFFYRHKRGEGRDSARVTAGGTPTNFTE